MLHLPLSLPGGLVRDLRSIGGGNASYRGRLRAWLQAELAPLPLQEPAEESLGSTSISAPLDEDVDNITVLVHGPPEVLLLAADIDEDLA